MNYYSLKLILMSKEQLDVSKKKKLKIRRKSIHFDKFTCFRARSIAVNIQIVIIDISRSSFFTESPLVSNKCVPDTIVTESNGEIPN